MQVQFACVSTLVLGRSVERTWWKEHGEENMVKLHDACFETSSTFNLSGWYFLLDKTVANFEKKVVEQYVEVLLDQETPAETPERLSLKILYWI